MKLAYNKATRSVINEKILAELKEYPQIIVFGAGKSGEWITKLLGEYELFPVCICDNSKRK